MARCFLVPLGAFPLDSSSDAGCEIGLLCFEVAAGDGDRDPVRCRLGSFFKLKEKKC